MRFDGVGVLTIVNKFFSTRSLSSASIYIDVIKIISFLSENIKYLLLLELDPLHGSR